VAIPSDAVRLLATARGIARGAAAMRRACF